jgi:hypothetical protein
MHGASDYYNYFHPRLSLRFSCSRPAIYWVSVVDAPAAVGTKTAPAKGSIAGGGHECQRPGHVAHPPRPSRAASSRCSASSSSPRSARSRSAWSGSWPLRTTRFRTALIKLCMWMDGPVRPSTTKAAGGGQAGDEPTASATAASVHRRVLRAPRAHASAQWRYGQLNPSP